jgi:hypothetical protein
VTTREVSLWDVEDAQDVPAVRDMTVGPVSTGDVREFCARYHYTGLGNNVPLRYGLWHGVVLYGVIGYNLPTRQTCASVFGEAGIAHVWHMGRLAMADAAPRNSESRLIGGSLRLIEGGRPNIWAVLTFAAQSAGHVGYVYQATNALYTGTGGDSSYLLDESGNRRGTKQGTRVTIAEIERRGWTAVREPPKHRYVYILGNRTERRQRMRMLRLPVLPYPKSVAA